MVFVSLSTVIPLLLLLSCKSVASIRTVNATSSHTISSFNLTAISAVKDASVLECWTITLPLTTSTTTGIEGAVIQSLGELSSMVWSSLPGGYAGSPHPAPSVQYNAVLSGDLLVTIPGSSQRAVIPGGKHGLILAADTANVSKTGHVSSILGKKELTALMIPTKGGIIPPHNVLHPGACVARDLDL